MKRVKTIDMKQLSEEIGKKISEKRIDEFKDATARGLYRSLPTLVQTSPVDTGLYAQSWEVFIGELEVMIGNTAPYAGIVEFGARPFTPPIGPLLAWAKRVLKDPSQPPNYSREVWGLAKGVQKKIEQNGMRPRHVLTNAMPEILANVRMEIRKL